MTIDMLWVVWLLNDGIEKVVDWLANDYTSVQCLYNVELKT